MNTDTQIILDRLARIEKENRWMRRGIAIGLLLVVSLIFTVQAAPSKNTVTAEEFILVDSDGAPRGKLEVGPSGAGRLVLWSGNGEVLFESPRRSLNDFANP